MVHPQSTTGAQTGLVLDIQRMSTEDGPGIRTTVFLKGCPLRCAWCHNPESISSLPEVHWVENRCIGCRTCITVCPAGALAECQDGIRINRDVCTGCLACTDACPALAMERLGKNWSSVDLSNEIRKDLSYFKASNGGVTLSGGEPTLQAGFSADVLSQLSSSGIHTALDTCGLCKGTVLLDLLPFCRMVLFDVKIMDKSLHKGMTGRSNKAILENLCLVSEYAHVNDLQDFLWVRTPIIPGVTDSRENIRDIGKFLNTCGKNMIARWELCAFNNLCKSKYGRLDREWMFRNTPLMTADEMESLADEARKTGVDPSIVHWSGSTRIHPDENRLEQPSISMKETA